MPWTCHPPSHMFHIERHQILTDCQHGFRKNRGCDMQLLITVDDIARTVEKGKQVDAVLLDFSKAFDRVLHQRLLIKLKHYGITGTMNRWISNFLTTRTQQVVLEGEFSATAEVNIWCAAGHRPRTSVIFTLCEWYPFICVVKNQAFCRWWSIVQGN